MSKRVFLENPFLLCRLKGFQDLSGVLRANLKGAEKKRTLQKHPFGQPFLRTTPSPLLWRALKNPQHGQNKYVHRKSPFWESAKVSHKRVFALLTPEIHSYEMAQMQLKPVFALPGCQRMSVNTLLCDTLALADFFRNHQKQFVFSYFPQKSIFGKSTLSPPPKDTMFLGIIWNFCFPLLLDFVQHKRTKTKFGSFFFDCN